MTEQNIKIKLEGKSERGKLKIICRQLNIWVKGAGWKDVRTPFQHNNTKFDLSYLLAKLKNIIQKHVHTEDGKTPWPVRAQVPRPSQLSSAKPLPNVGDTLCDALQGKEWAMEEDQQRLNELHNKEDIPRCSEEMPDFNSLKGKRVTVLFNNEENNNKDKGKCVKMWYFGKVNRTKKKHGMNEGCKAVIEWEAGGNETEKRWTKTCGQVQVWHLI